MWISEFFLGCVKDKLYLRQVYFYVMLWFECMISGFHCELDENCTLLRYTWVVVVPDGRFGKTYQFHLQGSRDGTDRLPWNTKSRILYLEHGASTLSRYVKGQDFISLDLGPISCPEMLLRNYHCSHNNAEELSSHLIVTWMQYWLVMSRGWVIHLWVWKALRIAKPAEGRFLTQVLKLRPCTPL